jgi:Immunity protein Imm1
MVPVRSEQELLDRLREIAAHAGEAPPLVELYQPDGSSLAIGVGAERSVVTFIPSPDEPDWLSRGEDDDGAPPVFYLHGHYSDFSPDAAVPADAAVEAMRRFYATGQRPDNIAWQQ